MSCGCAGRMRWILHRLGYQRRDGVWSRGPEDPTFDDDKLEKEHFRTLIETMSNEMWSARAKAFTLKARK